MKVLFNEVKKQIDSIDLGSFVEVIVANGTRRNGSSPYYRRKGILEEKRDEGTEIIIKVNINGRRYTMKLYHAKEKIGEKLEDTEYARGLYSIWKVAYSATFGKEKKYE